MRTFDPTFLNQVANIPSVRRTIGPGPELLDFSAALANPRNYAFQNDLGVFLLANIFGSSYEVHTFFSPRRKEDAAIIEALMFQAELYMFARTDCLEIITRVPDGNRWADQLANRFAFRDIGHQLDWADGRGAMMKRKTLEDWARGAPETHMAGRQFHEVLEAAKKAKGSTLPNHPDDSTHDSIVGAAMLMCKGGQPAKGITFYNYWAVLAGYRPVRLLSDYPPVVDVHDAIIGIDGNNLEVQLCRVAS